MNIFHNLLHVDLELIWLRNGKPTEYEQESRFVKRSDYSLIITNTIELDSGFYMCRAKTRLDTAEALASLSVLDVPNSPIVSVECNIKDATISWVPMGDNGAPVLNYIIEYNTSFTPNVWEVIRDQVHPGDRSWNVPISPWANYTFRVTAVNKIGPSEPSGHSGVCTTSPEVPHSNPDDVESINDLPTKLVITWTRMPQIHHNAPKFQYMVYWKQDILEAEYETKCISDWQQNRLVIDNVPSFTQYRIKVVALNEMGPSNVVAKEVIGYSGEDEPVLAPGNFTLVQIQSSSALFSWNSVPLGSIRGRFRGYKIKTWTENKVGHREIQVQGNATQALVNNFVPYSKNFAQVYAYNVRYDGPPSETLSFDMPEGAPGQIPSLQAYQLESTAFNLVWKKPDQPNGILRGYRIYYAVVNGTSVGEIMERTPNVTDPDQLQAILGGLQPNVKYRLYVAAVTGAGVSPKYFIERKTNAVGPTGVSMRATWDKKKGVIEQSESGAAVMSVMLVAAVVVLVMGFNVFIAQRKRSGSYTLEPSSTIL